jgi:APA family basic amino acid/polyamine antiporter
MDTHTPTPAASAAGLRRELGLVSTTASGIGEIVAVGIFLTSAGIAKALASPLWLLVV